MNKIKAIIVDDEQWARTVLANLLERNSDSVEVVAQCEDVPSAVEEINLHKPDVVFLDIQMPEYAGYEIVQFFKRIDFQIIFVTAFDQYAIKAFELNAIDYLTKPIDREKLVSAVNKLAITLETKNRLEQYQELLKSIKNKEHKKIVLPELGNRRVVDLDSIIAIEADDVYCKVHLSGGKEITVSKTLKYFENLLADDTCFFRSHRSWIINLKHLQEFNKTENIIVLEGNLKTLISRKKFADFETALKSH